MHYDEALANCAEDGLRLTLTVLIIQDVSENAERNVLIQVGEDLYEIAYSTDTDSGASLPQRLYNMLFIRYYKHETPQWNLYKNGSAWMRVGAGFLGGDTLGREQKMVWYDFQARLDIRRLDGPRDTLIQGGVPYSGRWEERLCHFT